MSNPHIPPLPAESPPIQLKRTAIERAVDRILGQAGIVPTRKQIFPGWWFDPSKVSASALMRLAAMRHGIKLDNLHHAPLCPANHFEMMRLPSGPCTCGAAAQETERK